MEKPLFQYLKVSKSHDIIDMNLILNVIDERGPARDFRRSLSITNLILLIDKRIHNNLFLIPLRISLKLKAV